MKNKVLLPTAIVSLLLLSGCSLPSKENAEQKIGEKIMEKAIESQTGGKVNVDTDNDQMNINTKDGNLSMSSTGEAKIPENFPTDIYVAEDAKVNFAASNLGTGKDVSIAYITAASLDDVSEKYKQEMTKNGYTKDTEMDMGSQGKVLTFKKGQTTASILIGQSQNKETAGKTSVQVTLVSQ